MSNLIPLKDAAKMLGIAPDRLIEMISKKEIFGYRDGSSWKFKQQEIERVADEFAIDLAKASPADAEEDGFSLSDSSLNDDLILDDSSDEKSDLHLSDSSHELMLEGDDDDAVAEGSNLDALDDEDDLLFGDSSLDLAAESSKKIQPVQNGNGDKKSGNNKDASKSPGKSPAGKGGQVGDSKEINLAEDDLFDDDIRLGESDSLDDAVDLGSDFEDSDVVLEDSDSSSELVLESNDKGISLSPSDSGISLSDSIELGGGDIDSLEMRDDDMVSMTEAADADAATLMQEDDFNLTPFEQNESDEASGSQVIALEDSDLFATDSESTLLGESDLQAQPQMVGTESNLFPAATAGAVSVFAAAEAPYTIWQVLSLGATAALLCLGFMVSFDVARNLWMPSDQVASNGILEFFLEMSGMK